MSKPKYKVGDIVKNSYGGNTTYKVIDIINDIYHYGIYLCDQFSHYNQVSFPTFENDTELVSSNVINETSNPIRTCTCEHYTLMNRGCMCGAVKRYRPSWADR